MKKPEQLLLFRNAVSVNFEIIYSFSQRQLGIKEFSLCCAFPDQMRILYHFDPTRATEDHPEYHLELTTDGEDAIWEGKKLRYPVGRVDPVEILRFFFRLAKQEPCLSLKRKSQ